MDIENEVLDIATSFGLIQNHMNTIKNEAFKTKRSFEYVKVKYMKAQNLNTIEETIHITQYNVKYCQADCVVSFKRLTAFNGIMKDQVFIGSKDKIKVM